MHVAGHYFSLSILPLGIADGVLRRQPDISLAKEILDGTPTIQREEGLKSTIPYFEKQLKISRRI